MYPVGYDPNSFVCEAGERYAPQFVGDVQSNGSVVLVETGKIDLWQMHSAGADQCDINKIVERFRDGDLTVLNRVQGTFADVAGLPRDLRGMYDLMQSLETGFNELPDDVRQKFGDFQTWLSSAGSEEWFQRMTRTVDDNIEKESASNAES